MIVALLFLAYCQNPDKIAREGIEQLNAGNKLGALNSFDKALEIDEENPVALYGRARILALNSETVEMARKDLEKVLPKLANKEDKLQGSLVLADIYYRYKDLRKAVTVLENALKEGLSSPRLYAHAGKYLVESRRFREAKTMFEQGLKAYPDHPDLLYDYAVYLATGPRRYKEATEIFVKSLEKSGPQPDILLNLVKLYYLQREYTKAMDILDKLSALNIPDEQKEKIDDLKKKIKTRRWNVRF